MELIRYLFSVVGKVVFWLMIVKIYILFFVNYILCIDWLIFIKLVLFFF